MAKRVWTHPKPEKPVPPCTSALDLLRRCCEEWGLDFTKYRHSVKRPCVPCKGGTLVTERGCPYCGGEGEGNAYAWRGFYAAVMGEFEDKLKSWDATLALHMAIKRKLLPRERDYLGIE